MIKEKFKNWFSKIKDNKNTDNNWIVRWLKNIMQSTFLFIITSGLFIFAKGIFKYSIKFHFTRTSISSVFSQGLFGTIIGILFFPLALISDIFILLFGLTIGFMLFAILIPAFPIILGYIFFKTVTNR
mgnify:CR=1 FL=1